MIIDIKKYFEALRNDEKHHLGLGDIRLTLAQQEEIIEAIETLRWELDEYFSNIGPGRSSRRC